MNDWKPEPEADMWFMIAGTAIVTIFVAVVTTVAVLSL
jgi:hypothetical protein